MWFDPLKGRLGTHRFHMMLVHFPTALYPFALVMDVLWLVTDIPDFKSAGFFSLVGGVGVSVLAMMYGIIDFLLIDSKDQKWNTAGIHGLLHLTWFIGFAILLAYQIKHDAFGITYVSLECILNAGVLVANYWGGKLVRI